MKLVFGKYKGKELEHVAVEDPDYIFWMNENNVMLVPDYIMVLARKSQHIEPDFEMIHGDDWGNRS